MATKRHYVYLHRRKDTDEVFYVGKGFGKRAWKKTTRSEWWKRIEAKYGRTVEIYREDLSEFEAFVLEAELILKFGRDNLCNLTDGGEGGVNPSEATRLKMSLAKKGRIVSDATREKMRIASTGRRHSEETKEKLRSANLGKPGHPHTEASKLAISTAQKGKIRSPEHCAKISAAKIGKPGHKPTPEEIERMRQRSTGRTHSDESRRKVGDANRGRKHTAEEMEKIVKNNQRLNKARRIPILCSNGMRFEYSGEAEAWLQANGFPKASRTNIVSVVNGKLKTAYGFSWTRDLE